MTSLPNSKPGIITVHRATTSLGLKNHEFTEILHQTKIGKVKNSRGQWAISIEDFNALKTVVKDSREQAKANKVSDEAKEEQFRSEVAKIKNELRSNVKVNTRERLVAPLKTILFVGPTNSGKTYHGLEQLFYDYDKNPELTHVYCGPLRLLAFEVYNKMVARYGVDKVGFITGEEQINPTAKLLATTAEMAPSEGNSILIDEAHWLAEPSRGHVWTKLLYSTTYNNIYALTASEAVPLIEKLTAQSYYTDIKRFERKTPIVYKGTIDIAHVPNKTAIVCFSRKSVYTVANFLQKKGRKVGVLYGGLPLKARKKQIEAYEEGKYDVMVVTDVIGHGINLPIDNVVFTQTEKFDGSDVRPVHIWEGAQIAGRAGRFGLSEEGSVYLGEGLPWLSKDRDIVKTSVLAAGGKVATDLDVDTAIIAPKLNDLGLDIDGGVESAAKILPAIYQWQMLANRTIINEPLEASTLNVLTKNILTVLQALHIPTAPWNEGKIFTASDYPKNINVDINELWQLGSGPYDASLPSLIQIAEWLFSPYREESSRLTNFFNENVWVWAKNAKTLPAKEAANNIEAMETAIRINAELKMAMVMFGIDKDNTRWLGTLNETKLHDAEEYINDSIIKILSMGIKTSNLGICSKCNKPTSPWFKDCDSCHQQSKSKSDIK
jgi:ATP-dependent RNA helicase SUPV3L1/SUV3